MGSARDIREELAALDALFGTIRDHFLASDMGIVNDYSRRLLELHAEGAHQARKLHEKKREEQIKIQKAHTNDVKDAMRAYEARLEEINKPLLDLAKEYEAKIASLKKEEARSRKILEDQFCAKSTELESKRKMLLAALAGKTAHAPKPEPEGPEHVDTKPDIKIPPGVREP